MATRKGDKKSSELTEKLLPPEQGEGVARQGAAGGDDIEREQRVVIHEESNVSLHEVQRQESAMRRRRDMNGDLGATWRMKLASEESSKKFLIMLVLSSLYLIAELVFGVVSGSLALLADAFHMISDVVAILVGLWVARLATRRKTGVMSFGWRRAEVVGAFANGCFLLAVCFTISLEAIEKLAGIGRDNQADLEANAVTVLFVGVGGLLINLLGMCVFGGHGHSHGGGDHGHSHGGGHGHSHAPKQTKASPKATAHAHAHGEAHEEAHAHEHEHAAHAHAHAHAHDDAAAAHQDSHAHAHGEAACGGEEAGHGHEEAHEEAHGHAHAHGGAACGGHGAEEGGHGQRDGDGDGEEWSRGEECGGGHGGGGAGRNLNEWAMYLHVMGDALGSAAVVGNACIIHWSSSPYRFLADPICSLLIVVIILLGTVPLMLETAHILMEGAPASISEEIGTVESLEGSLLGVRGVLEVHELHLWRLTQRTLLCTVHVVVKEEATAEVMRIVDDIKALLHANNIHSSTIQAEAVGAGEEAAVAGRASNCADLVCADEACIQNSCCGLPGEEEEGAAGL